MFISPFIAGVLATIVAEFAILLIAALIVVGKNEDEN